MSTQKQESWGPALRRIRLEEGVEPEVPAELVGVKPQTILKWEREDQIPVKENWEKLTAIFPRLKNVKPPPSKDIPKPIGAEGFVFPDKRPHRSSKMIKPRTETLPAKSIEIRASAPAKRTSSAPVYARPPRSENDTLVKAGIQYASSLVELEKLRKFREEAEILMKMELQKMDDRIKDLEKDLEIQNEVIRKSARSAS